MKFGLFYNTGYYGTDPDQMIAAARHAERCGFESFYMGEHGKPPAPRAGTRRRWSTPGGARST
jgi:alkanesulfonate monooxygenase SsuD/methylene tetrahydromethanopterin reductase-like flavin-dependent oxidoreductase (luciferase family)